MARPSSVTARHIADQYATQAMVVELLRYLARSDPQIISALQSASRAPHILKPVDDDVIVSEQHVRDSFEAILNKAIQA
jgi:hypothetical protein